MSAPCSVARLLGLGLLGAGTRSLHAPGAGPDDVDMSKVIGALGFHTERVSVQPRSSRPCGGRSTSIRQVARPMSSSPAASAPSTASGLDGARSETMPKLSGRLENAGAMCHHKTKEPEVRYEPA